MRRRITLVAVLALLALGLPGPLAGAQSEPEDFCAFLPDGAAKVTPRYYGDTPACIGNYRPNETGSHDASVLLFGFPDPATARENLDLTLDDWAGYGHTVGTLDIGDAGAERDARGTTSVPDYEWAFVRGPVMVWVDTTTTLVPDGVGLVADLARETDARLAAHYGGTQATTTTSPPSATTTQPAASTTRPEPATSVTSGTAPPVTGPGSPATTAPVGGPDLTGIGEEIMVAALDPAGGVFGDAEADLWSAVADATGCPFGSFADALLLRSPAGPVPTACRNAAERAGQAMSTLTQDAADAFPKLADEGLLPVGTSAQSQAALHAAVAVYLANLDAPDDTALFPGVRSAESVIMILGRGGVLGVELSQVSLSRFVSLTVGRDVLGWGDGA